MSTTIRQQGTPDSAKATMLSTRISVDLMLSIDARAAADGEPRSDLVRRALVLYIDKERA